MLPRALVPGLLCVSALWPLRAFACINSMDGARQFDQFFLVDLFLWSTGAVFLNRVVLVNVRGSAATGQPAPAAFRRTFFMLVGAALVLLLAVVSAGGPLFDFSAEDVARCSPSLPMLLVLMAIPAALFSLHGAFFHALDGRGAGGKGWRGVVSLVLSSVVLVAGFWIARDAYILPRLCRSSTFFSGIY